MVIFHSDIGGLEMTDGGCLIGNGTMSSFLDYRNGKFRTPAYRMAHHPEALHVAQQALQSS